MFAESSYLGWNLTVIVLVWLTAVIIGQIIKYALLQAVATKDAINLNSESVDKSVITAQIERKIQLFNIAVSATAIITLVIFILFMNHSQAKKTGEITRISPAPLPENFVPPSKEQIKRINQKVTTVKSEKMRQQAVKMNNKAMQDAAKLFNNTK